MAEPTIIVRLDSGARHISEYGPFPNRRQADAFAAFLTAEVDPARVWEAYGINPDTLLSPVGPLLAWYADVGDEMPRLRAALGSIVDDLDKHAQSLGSDVKDAYDTARQALGIKGGEGR